MLAVLLAGCAALLLLRPSAGAPPVGGQQVAEREPPAGVPLVLPLADPATATVLDEGERVDLYVAQGDQPPALALSGVHLLDIQSTDRVISGTTGHSGHTAYIVVQISFENLGLIESLLAATSIVATVSAVPS